jgi:nucleoside-diphosphate-sugar epimerase/GT2 family glycosyltransferase
MAPERKKVAPRRVLVTGAAGFVGSNLADELLARGHDVVGVDNFLPNYGRGVKWANLRSARESGAFAFHEIDLARDELDAVVDGVDAAFHLAARPGVRESWGQHYAEYLTNNVLATQRLLEALRARADVPLILASSSSVYGDAADLPVAEDATPAPVSPYGATKLAAEDLVDLYRKSYGLRAVVLRYFTVYGPRQRPDMAIHKFIRAIMAGDAIVLYGDGEERRDFTYVADAVKATADVLANELTSGTYNVASGKTVSLAELTAALEKVLGKKAEVTRAPHQRGDVRATHGDISALRKAIGYDPATSLEEGLAAQAEWMTREAAPTKVRTAAGRPAARRARLSVIIVNYNSGHVVHEGIDSCWRNPPAEGEMEIIVVDNASSDGSAQALAARDDIIFIRNRQNLGYAAANNQGLAAARGDYLMLLNPDVEVSPGVFDKLIDFLDENPDAGVAGPALISPAGRLQESYRRFPNLLHLIGSRKSLIYRFWPGNPFSRRGFYGELELERPVKVDFIAGAAMMFKRELVDLIGPLDPHYFMYVEDADFSRRARDAGYYTYLVPNITVLHHWGESAALHPYRVVFIHHISMMRYLRMHQPLQFALYLLLLPLVGVHLAFELAYAWRATRRRKKQLAAERARAGEIEDALEES